MEEPILMDDSGCEEQISYDEWLKINDNTNTGSFIEDSAMIGMTSETIFKNNRKDLLNLNSTMNDNLNNSEFMNFTLGGINCSSQSGNDVKEIYQKM